LGKRKTKGEEIVLKIALEYLQRHKFSVIPVAKNKKPLIKWEEFQRRLPTEEEVREWFTKYPDANIGIVTGELSGIAVIDIDNNNWEIFDVKKAPAVKTPRGYHFYCLYKDGITNTVRVEGKPVDIRGEGGYVVAPPSVNGEGKRYTWIRSLSIGLPEFPMEILAKSGEKYNNHSDLDERLPEQEIFIEGRRDEDLFHAAHLLIKSNASETFTKDVVMRLARTCDPPFPEQEALTKVESAIKRAVRKERPIAQELREWIDVTLGWWSITFCYNELQVITPEDKNIVRVSLSRMVKKSIVERHPSRAGYYRKIELECEEMDWQNAPTDDVDIKFPLDIHELVRIYPGNIIIIAGEPNAGKTAFLLETIRINMDRHSIHYFNSEMGSSELKIRLGLFEAEKAWDFTAWERADNFSDVIRPDMVNIIDFLDITDEFWKVGTVIKDIHAKLRKGIAIIALQKNFGRDVGRGGELSLEKPRLYLAMSRGEIKVVKAKNWRGDKNPNGKVKDFKLYKGSVFSETSLWHYPDLTKGLTNTKK